MRHPQVEVLYFAGCPNVERARTLVEEVAADLRVTPEIRLVEVPDADAAARMRFLGSPTIRVAGRDVEPGADDREGFVFACRLYRAESGFVGQPDEAWVRHALAEARP